MRKHGSCRLDAYRCNRNKKALYFDSWQSRIADAWNRLMLLPLLQNSNQSAAWVLLQDAIYKAVNASLIVTQPIQYQWDPVIPAGYVISQTPASGGVVPVSTPVYFVVSKGPQPAVTQATVPNVVGQWIQDAQNTLTNAGCEWGRPVWQYSSTVTGELVISQSVTAGTLVPRGTIVILTVSQGPPVTTLPGATVVVPLMH
jgi:beta-lactam-binding protein with PASTA domain